MLVLFFTGLFSNRTARVFAREIQGIALTDSLFGTIQEAEQILHRVYTSLDGDGYEDGVNAYYYLLDRLDQAPFSKADSVILTRHLRGVSMVMPAAQRNQIGLAPPDAPVVIDNLMPAAGAYIKKWWRSQDNLPATEINERLNEHLVRFFEAHKYFKNKRDLRGVDDRGEIYIRLGNPSKKTKLRLQAPAYIANGQGLKLPANEFWVYRHVGYDAQYLFIEHSRWKGHQLGSPAELIPRQIQNSRRYTNILLEWMEEIYGQLALLHNAYGQRYDEVTNYLTLRPANAPNPEAFARSLFQSAQTEDLQLEWQRDQTIPVAHSNTYGSVEPLPISVRWTRFLDEDGTTRTEVDWSFNGRLLSPSRRLRRQLYKEGHEPSEKFLITSSLAHRSATHETKSITHKSYLVPSNIGDHLPAKSFTIEGETGLFNLAVQLDAKWTLNDEESSALQPGARVKIGTVSIDSLDALSNNPADLVISDIRPLRMRPDQSLEEAQPYPHKQLTRDLPLALYFEVYNLTYNAEDLTQLAVEYEIVRRSAGGLLRRKGKVKSRNTIKTDYVGESRTAKEFIIPDLQDWDEDGEVEIIVQVTDEPSGRQTSRSIKFSVSSGSSS